MPLRLITSHGDQLSRDSCSTNCWLSLVALCGFTVAGFLSVTSKTVQESSLEKFSFLNLKYSILMLVMMKELLPKEKVVVPVFPFCFFHGPDLPKIPFFNCQRSSIYFLCCCKFIDWKLNCWLWLWIDIFKKRKEKKSSAK